MSDGDANEAGRCAPHLVWVQHFLDEDRVRQLLRRDGQRVAHDEQLQKDLRRREGVVCTHKLVGEVVLCGRVW